MKQFIYIILILSAIMSFTGCPDPAGTNNTNQAVNYTISYKANGADSGTVPASQIKTGGVNLALAANTGNLTLTGYSFSGWNTAGNIYSEDADAVLYAEWEILPTYTINFESNDGSVVSDIDDVTQGNSITEPVDPEKASFNFVGWYKESTLDTVWNFSTDTVTSDITLYAKWTSLPIYTVNLVSNGGSSVAEITNVIEGEAITAPANPTLTDYTLGGWFKESVFTNAWNFSTDTVTADTTLYAKWNPNSYTVSASLTVYAKWQPYAIGDAGPAGGIIFYDKGSYSDS